MIATRMLMYIAIDGLIYASWLFLITIGLSVIYGVLRVLNVAHGSLYALGAYAVAWSLSVALAAGMPVPWSYIILVIVPLLVGGVIGLAIEKGVLQKVYVRDEVAVLLLTYAIFLILEDVIKLVWGVQPYVVSEPYAYLGDLSLAGITHATYPFVLVGLAVVVGTAVWLALTRTRYGRLVICVIEDREISVACGVNVAKIFTVTFICGASLAALAGGLAAPMISVVPGVGVEAIILGFAVVAIGGLGSIPGAAAGSLIVGLMRSAAVQLIPEVELAVIYAVMAGVLVIRPQGLFGRVEVRRI